MNCSTAEQINQLCSRGYSPIQIACKKNNMDIVLFSIHQGLPAPGTSNVSNSMQLPWFKMLNNANQQHLLALAEQNRDEYYTSHSTFLSIIQKTVQLKRLHQPTNNATTASAVANAPITHFCLNHPQQPLRLIADYLCGPKEARLLWYHIILHCASRKKCRSRRPKRWTRTKWMRTTFLIYKKVPSPRWMKAHTVTYNLFTHTLDHVVNGNTFF